MATPAPVEIGSLVGLESVAGLIVEELDSEVAKNGSSSADVRAEIEVLLYKYGLLKRDSNLFGPFLHVQVGTYKIENTFAFTIRLEFYSKNAFCPNDAKIFVQASQTGTNPLMSRFVSRFSLKPPFLSATSMP